MNEVTAKVGGSAGSDDAGLAPPETVRDDLPPRIVAVGPFRVSDERADELVIRLVKGAVDCLGSRPFLAYALHVGGLNDRGDRAFVEAMGRADVVYADGMSVVLLARLAGASRLERAGTTDIGWGVLRALSAALGRPARVALVGGPDGLTARAGAVLAADAGVRVVATEHGYHGNWDGVLERVAAARPDLFIVGLGAPREMKWVEAQRGALPDCLVMTCGGWFGFLTAREKRAPGWMQSVGLEWAYRLTQAPRRLAGRYIRGAGTTAVLAVQLVRVRFTPARSRQS